MILRFLVALGTCLLCFAVSVAAQKQLAPAQVDSLYRQGLAAVQAGDLPKARAAFEQVVRLAPGSAEGHNLLGWVLFAQGQTAESIAQFKTALRLKPDLAAAHVNLANALVKNGALAEAESEARAALRLLGQRRRGAPDSGKNRQLSL